MGQRRAPQWREPQRLRRASPQLASCLLPGELASRPPLREQPPESLEPLPPEQLEPPPPEQQWREPLPQQVPPPQQPRLASQLWPVGCPE